MTGGGLRPPFAHQHEQEKVKLQEAVSLFSMVENVVVSATLQENERIEILRELRPHFKMLAMTYPKMAAALLRISEPPQTPTEEAPVERGDPSAPPAKRGGRKAAP